MIKQKIFKIPYTFRDEKNNFSVTAEIKSGHRKEAWTLLSRNYQIYVYLTNNEDNTLCMQMNVYSNMGIFNKLSHEKTIPSLIINSAYFVNYPNYSKESQAINDINQGFILILSKCASEINLPKVRIYSRLAEMPNFVKQIKELNAMPSLDLDKPVMSYDIYTNARTLGEVQPLIVNVADITPTANLTQVTD